MVVRTRYAAMERDSDMEMAANTGVGGRRMNAI